MHYVIVPAPGFRTFQILLEEEDRMGAIRLHEGSSQRLPKNAYEWRQLLDAVLLDAARIFWRRVLLVASIRKGLISRLGPAHTLNVYKN
jgi:hypothetical protein